MVLLIASLVILNLKTLIKENKRFISLFKATLTTIPLVIFYLAPMIEQFLYQDLYVMNKPLFKLSENTLSIKNLLLYTLFTNPYSATIGILSATYLLIYLKNWKKLSKSSKHLVSIRLFCCLGTTNLFYWVLLDNTFVNNIQFPWRLFSVATLLISWYMSIDDLGLLDKKLVRRSTVTLSILTLITFEIIMRFTTPFFIKNEEFNDVSNSFIGVGQEYLPLTTSYAELKVILNDEFPKYNKENGTVKVIEKGYGKIELAYDLKKPTEVVLPFINYKGYEATIKGSETETVVYPKKGLATVKIDGKNEVIIEYKGTSIQKYSLLFSFLSMIIFSIYLYKKKVLK